MAAISLTPTQLFKEIKEWEQISCEREGKKWVVNEEGAVSLLSKENSLFSKISSTWYGKNDLGVVYEAMAKRFELLSEKRFSKIVQTPNSSKKWSEYLSRLKESINQKTKRYNEKSGIIHSIYRGVVLPLSDRGKVNERSQSLLQRIDSLLEKCNLGKKPTTELLPQGKYLEVHANPLLANLRPIVIDKIEQAKKRITVFMYSINDPKVIEALEEKAKEGVKVQIIGQSDTFQYAEKEIDPSIQVTEVKDCKGLMHHKIAVIDDTEVLYGSANWTKGGLKNDRNILTAIKSNKLAQGILSKADSIINTKDTSSTSSQTDIKSLSITLPTKQKIELSFLPDDTEALSKITKLIDGAKKTIDVAMYTWTHEGLADKIIEKHKQGVEVTAIIDGGQGGKTGTGNKITQKLLDAQIPVILAPANKFKLMHHKFLRIDKETVVHGSANWTQAVFGEKNMDSFAIFTKLDKDDISRFDAVWENLKEVSSKQKAEKK